MARKDWERHSMNSLLTGDAGDKRGRLFLSPLGQVDLSGVKFLHQGVDTVKQLYSGTMRPFPLEVVQTAYEAGFRQVVEIDGYQWLVGSGRAGGYRYTLRNADSGLVVLLGSLYVPTDKEGSHLKAELSPHYLQAHTPEQAQAELDKLARIFLVCPSPVGIACHVCADFQGWEPPADFEARLVTRSKRQANRKGFAVAEFDLSEVSAVYDDRQSFLYGCAAALQFAMYRKDREAKASDKIHFWEAKWNSAHDENLERAYNPEKPVWRVETRFHHTVVEEFARGLDEEIKTYAQLSRHLTGLWRYALNSYRLDASRTYIDPFWQLLRDDVQLFAPAPDVLYKRVRKGPGVGGERNVSAALGNLLSCYARQGFTSKQSVHFLKHSGIWDDLVAWQWKKEMSLSMFHQWVEQELIIRKLMGKAA